MSTRHSIVLDGIPVSSDRCCKCDVSIPAGKEFYVIGYGTHGRNSQVCETCFKKAKADGMKYEALDREKERAKLAEEAVDASWENFKP